MTVPLINYFAEISIALDLMNSVPVTKANAKTTSGYEVLVKRIVDRASAQAKIDNPGAGGVFSRQLVEEARKTTKVRTWQSRRAALLYIARIQIGKSLARQETLQRKLREANIEVATDPRWQDAVGLATFWAAVIESVRSAPPIPADQRKNKHSKRQDIKRLPFDWRTALIARLPKYRLATLAQAVTGCRPEELQSGVELRIAGAMLIARIHGSKVTVKSGQPWRELHYPLQHEGELVPDLIAMVVEAGGVCVARVASGTRYTGALRAAGKRLYPDQPGKKPMPDITAYCFRHAAASDMKASKLSGLQISAALGHCTEVTKSNYGSFSQGKKGGVSPIRVTAAREVKANANPRQRPGQQAQQAQQDDYTDDYEDTGPGPDGVSYR